ncbi:MAG: RNA-binding protein [Candidatus Binatia bacterium]
MPKGPRGERRPADVIGAVHVMRIATGEIEKELAPPSAAKEYMRKGGKARAEKLAPAKRKAIAR